jgi:hypothetical protein
MSAMVKYFHEVRDGFSCTRRQPSGMENYIFHRMKIFLLLHEWKHSLFVLYDTKIVKMDPFIENVSELNTQHRYLSYMCIVQK